MYYILHALYIMYYVYYNARMFACLLVRD